MMRNLTDFMKDLSTRANERTVQRLAKTVKPAMQQLCIKWHI